MKKFKKYILYSSIIAIVVVSVSRWRVVSVSDEYIFDEREISQIDDCQNIVLLGAKVKFDGSMSPILKERAMAVEDLYKDGKVCKIVISGYREIGDDYVYDEVTPVRKYFIEQGIPEGIIISDYEGVDTFTSMKNARDKFDMDKIVVVTQDFHLPRAVYIGRALGVETCGYVAYKFPYPTKTGMYKDMIREWPAALKAVGQSELLLKK